MISPAHFPPPRFLPTLFLQELVLEHSLADTPKARAYAKRFFDSGPTMAFILARLYAWYVTPHTCLASKL